VPAIVIARSEETKKGLNSPVKYGEISGSVMLSQESNLFLVRVNRILQIVFSLFVLSSEAYRGQNGPRH
jgi:hypothetical protein